jgi:hypothetical protein
MADHLCTEETTALECRHGRRSPMTPEEQAKVELVEHADYPPHIFRKSVSDFTEEQLETLLDCGLLNEDLAAIARDLVAITRAQRLRRENGEREAARQAQRAAWEKTAENRRFVRDLAMVVIGVILAEVFHWSIG